MPGLTAADTIRILIATDNHVGYQERDPIRGEDSWRSFDEVLTIAEERDVDMVLLAGDLFHDNKPSRKALYHVMSSLRKHCLGMKPCELELLSDNSEVFEGRFNYVNYEDPDINVAIPVFSIHGNHDDPSGEGHLAALDILQTAGLINYYGRTPESDNIQIKPVLLQKGRTKLALYGLSNVRDERLFRTFRDGKVKFFQPGQQKSDWFNLMSVHQNHHAYTETGYLPENFLPSFLDLVVWGHEHECLIDPTLNPETNFHVMQPGSSVATSLCLGEAVPKQVALLTLKGRDFETENVRLKSVRPFVMREISLSQEKETSKLAKKPNNRADITRYLEGIVNELIEEAQQEWVDAQGDELDEEKEPPLPLIRLRVDYSTPDGGSFDCENPQRFSNRFQGKVANRQDVVQFHRKKTAGGTKSAANLNGDVKIPEDAMLAAAGLDAMKVDKLVKEFLESQALQILPQNVFSDAVNQFVDKDDKRAMESFVKDSLAKQVDMLMDLNRNINDEDLMEEFDKGRSRLEEIFAARDPDQVRGKRKVKLKPQPPNWDSDMDGPWADQPEAIIGPEDNDGQEEEEDQASDVTLQKAKAAPKGRSRGAAASASASAAQTKKTGARGAATTKKPSAKGGRGKKKVVEESEESEEEDDDDDDVVMVSDHFSDDDAGSESQLFTQPEQPPAPPTTRRGAAAAAATSTRGGKKGGATATAAAAAAKAKAPAAPKAKETKTRAQGSKQTQSQLNFSQTAPSSGTRTGVGVGTRGKKATAVKVESSGGEFDDDDIEDDFEVLATSRGGRGR